MNPEVNKAVVRRFWAAYEANDIDVLNEVLSPALEAQTPASPAPQTREMHLQGIAMFTSAFSDRRFTVDELVADGDLVATRTTLRGTHTGAFQDLQPTGKQLVATGLTLERVRDGQIVERWFSFDVPHALGQLRQAEQPEPAG